MKNIVTEISQQVTDQENYFLSIVIGEAQIGYSSFRDFEGKYISGNIVLHPIGKGENIRGKKLIITSMVTDVNPNTNLTSITYRLNDANIDTVSETVESNNSSIFYTTYLSFI